MNENVPDVYDAWAASLSGKEHESGNTLKGLLTGPTPTEKVTTREDGHVDTRTIRLSLGELGECYLAMKLLF